MNEIIYNAITSLILPIIFVILAMLVKRPKGDTREGDKKLKVTSNKLLQDKYVKNSMGPMTVDQFKQEFDCEKKHTMDIIDIEELAPRLSETSAGIDLGLGAIATLVSSFLLLAVKSSANFEVTLLYVATGIFQLLVLVLIVMLEDKIQFQREVGARIAFALYSNLLGVILMASSFLLLLVNRA